MKGFFFLLNIALFTYTSTLGQENHNDAYRLETIETPKGLTAQTGGIDFLPDGRLVACFMRGEVMTYDPQKKEWKLFAEGLQMPLGILAVNNEEVLVMQQPNLVRIKDTDHDGHADVFENATDEFGISGNYHEFNYGPARDKSGNLFFALNTASSAGSVRATVRGRLNAAGRDGLDGKGQMFSVVPYRGWVMELTKDGKTIPYASGFRSPNGIGFDLEGNLFVCDNQSDWVPTGSLYHVRKDHFYGHPASLVWKSGWKNKDPFNMPVSMLDSMRTKAAVLFPQGIMANSPSQPIADPTKGKFGPFSGQLFVGEMNRNRILRVMLEKVQGEFQGACISFMDGHGLRAGNNRLAFAPDGSLWVGQIGFGGWAGESGLQRIVFTGKNPMDIYSMSLTDNGFDLRFTDVADKQAASNLSNYKMRRYRYDYHKRRPGEGVDDAPQVDLQDITINDVHLSEDGKKISLIINDLKPGFIYELTVNNIASASGKPLANKLICYTLNNLRSVKH